MPSISYNIKYKKNSKLVISPQEVKEIYMFGISPIDPATGQEMTNESIAFMIEAAQDEIENYLSIKLKRQYFKESFDFQLDNFRSYNHMSVTYQMMEPISLKGHINSHQVIEYPLQWLTTKKSSDQRVFSRNLNIVPGGNGTVEASSALFFGLTPGSSFHSNRMIPNYWHVEYATGFDRVPKDLVDTVGKLSTIGIFNELGDIVLGAGLAASSVSIDGLSQSITTTNSSTNAGFGARVLNYGKELKEKLPKLKAFYGSIGFTAI